MNHVSTPQDEQMEKLWDVAVDVSKATLDWYAEGPNGRGSQGELANTNARISAWLDERTLQARTLGFDRVRVTCERTGGYEKRLLHLARHAGCATAGERDRRQRRTTTAAM